MPLQSGNKVGRECNLYYNSGTYSSPTWTLVPRAVDVSVPMDKSYGNVSSRNSKYKKERASLIGLQMTFGYRFKSGTDSVFSALRASALANTETEFLVIDDLVANTAPRAFDTPSICSSTRTRRWKTA